MITILPLPLFFSLAETGAASILEQGLSLSQGTTDAWDKQWENVFSSTLYTAINDLAITFAVGSLLIFIIQLYRKSVFEEIGDHLDELIWPLIVIAMLASNSYLTANLTLTMRSAINTTSNDILSTTLLQVKLSDAVQNAVLRSAIGGQITAQISQCEGLVGQPQKDCLISANEQVQKGIQDFQQKTGIPSSFVRIAAAIENSVRQIPTVNGVTGAVQNGTAQIGNGNVSGVASSAVAGFFGGYLNATVQAVVQTILLAFQWAFANTLQIAMLLTGLMGPLAVAGSLLPFGAKSLYTWIIGFFSLGMAQISYNIIVGLCAVVIVNADITDVNGFLVIVGLLGPALALAIATGGGISVFNVVTSGIAGTARIAAQGVAMVL